MTDFKVMLAKSYDPKRVQNWKEVWCEPKLDGVRVIVIVPKLGPPRYYSRNGRELGMFTHMNPSVRALAKRLPIKGSVVLDTEAVGVTFGDVSGAIHTKGTVALTCRLHVFHCMPEVRFHRGLDCETQYVRADHLSEAVLGRPIQGITVAQPVRALDHQQVMAIHKGHRTIDPKTGKPRYEGTMVKNLQEMWIAKRTAAWMKIKDECTADVKVTGIKEGTGKYVGMCGALICEYKKRKVRVSGMTDAQRKQFFDHPKSIIGKLVEVSFHEETEGGSLRHPRFERVRDDKQ